MISKIAFRNTVKNWRHSISALLSLSASFVSLVLFDGYMEDIKSMYNDNFRNRQMLGDMIIENKNQYSKEALVFPENFWINKEDQEKIKVLLEKKELSVKATVRNIAFQGMVTNGQQSHIFLARGYDVAQGEIMRGESWSWNVTFGRPIKASAVDEQNLVFEGVMGQGLSKKLNCQWIKDPKRLTFYGGYKNEIVAFNCPRYDFQLSTTTVNGQLNAVDLNIVGLVDGGYKDVDDRYFQTSLEFAQALLDTDKVSYISIMLQTPDHLNSALNYLSEQLKKINSDLIIMKWQDHRLGEMFKKTMDFLSIFRNFVIIVIIIISTLSVLNTMIKIVKERTREIGTMRSLGFRQNQIIKMFFLESVYLSLIGNFFGAFIAVLLMSTLNSFKILYKAGLLSEPVAFKIAFSFNAYIVAFSLLMFVSLLATFFATRQITKSKIVDNLNYA